MTQESITVLKQEESKLLGRKYYEVVVSNAAGKLSRREAAELIAREMKASIENVGIISIDQKTGKKDVVVKFFIFESEQARKLFPEHLSERMLTKEEREKLKQERRKKEKPKEAK